jgi:hypothetical protein
LFQSCASIVPERISAPYPDFGDLSAYIDSTDTGVMWAINRELNDLSAQGMLTDQDVNLVFYAIDAQKDGNIESIVWRINFVGVGKTEEEKEFLVRRVFINNNMK